MGADAATGLPEDLGSGRDLGAVASRPARPRRRQRAAGGTPQQADDRLAVHAGDDDDLVQELTLLRPGGLLVPLSLSCGVLAQAGSRHGALLGWIGNRDF
jgi:hypothetical protein